MAVTPDWVLIPKYYLPTTGGMQTFTNRLAEHLEAVDQTVTVVTKKPVDGRPILKICRIASAQRHTQELHSDDFWEAVLARLAALPPGRRVLAVGLEYEDAVDRQLNALVRMKEDCGHRVGLRVTTTFDLARRLTPDRAALLDRLDAVFVLNSHMASEAQQHGLEPPRLATLPLLIDSRLFAPAGARERRSLRESFNLPADAFVALWTGRLCSRKQLDEMVTAWAQAQTPGVLWLIGDDEDLTRSAERDLIRAASSLGVAAPIFHEALPPNAMSDAYKAADIFVSTSQVEGMSNSMLEAAAVGLPVVAYAVPGNTDLCRHLPSPGWNLASLGDVAAIAAGISAEARRPLTQVTLRATREPSLVRFSWDTVSGILDEALGAV